MITENNLDNFLSKSADSKVGHHPPLPTYDNVKLMAGLVIRRAIKHTNIIDLEFYWGQGGSKIYVLRWIHNLHT